MKEFKILLEKANSPWWKLVLIAAIIIGGLFVFRKQIAKAHRRIKVRRAFKRYKESKKAMEDFYEDLCEKEWS